VRLYPELHDRATAMVTAESFEAVLAVLQRARTELGASLCAFEVMWRNYLDEVRRKLPQVRMPVGAGSGALPPYAILLEIEMQSGAADLLMHCLENASAAGEISDAMLAQSQAQADDCWALRDAIAQLLQMYAHSVAFDVSLPLATMRAYSEQVAANLAAAFPSTTALCFGHLGDGTLHYIVDAPDAASKDRLLELVLAPLTEHGGAVSAEHGIGVTKREYLALCRSTPEIAQMRRLKSWLDPHDILNPGRVFD
jgi:FAD/FMN-containing dehydrogenase